MARRNIENIRVGNNPLGKAYGGYIYNMNCSVGQQGEATKVHLEVVSEDGNYSIADDDLNAVDPITITVGDEAVAGGSIVFKSMFPVGYEYSNTLSAKTLKVTYTDGSSILDKIQVVILNKQANPANFEGGRWLGVDPIWYVGNFASLWQIPVKCNNVCPSTGFPAWGPGSRNPWLPTIQNAINNRNPAPQLPLGAPRPSIAPYTQLGSRAMVTNVDPANLALGGVILVGQEDFVSSACQIPNVSYEFNDLHLLITRTLGIPMKNFGINHDDGTISFPSVRESFSGTLKEVLNEWCALFGLGYTWDFGNDELVAHALNDAQLASDMADLYQIVDKQDFEATTSDNPIVISDVNFTKSIEGTYHQDDISTYSKPAKKSTERQEFIERVLFAPLTLHSIIPFEEGTDGWNRLTGHRTEKELIISSILSKYNQNARTLYNFFIIAKKTNDFADVGGFAKYGRPLGLNLKHKLTDDERNDLLSYTMNIKDYVANSEQYGKDAAAFLGTYSEEKERGWIDWERKIADFIGKYYIIPEEIEKAVIRNYQAQFCFDRTVETKPQTEIFQKDIGKQAPSLTEVPQYNMPKSSARLGAGGQNQNAEPNYYVQDLPFEDLLKHPNGAVLPKLVHPITKEAVNKFRLYTRNARYGVEEEVDVEPLFFKESQEILKDFLPTYSELDSNAQTFLFEVIKDAFPDVYNKLDSLKNEEKKPNLLFFPKKEKILEVFDVEGIFGTPGYKTDNIMAGGGGNIFNDNEFVRPETEDPKEIPCNLLCDWDLTSFLCDCPEGDGYNPNFIGLTAAFGRYIVVKVKGQSKRWTLPSEYPYSGYIFVNTAIQKTLPGIQQNYGLLSNAKGTMGYRINFRNITSDIDASDQDLSLPGGNVTKANEGDGQIMASVAIPGRGVIGARLYHNQTQQRYTMNQIAKNLRFTVVGLNWLPFAPYMSAASGMTGLNISYSESGLQLSLEFANRPPVLPDQTRLLSRIEPRLNSNAFLRTF
tara:strand:+ start:215 stop:3187 length:2973 start_codon:yes stop_codon:yes gene_type:complete